MRYSFCMGLAGGGCTTYSTTCRDVERMVLIVEPVCGYSIFVDEVHCPADRVPITINFYDLRFLIERDSVYLAYSKGISLWAIIFRPHKSAWS